MGELGNFFRYDYDKNNLQYIYQLIACDYFSMTRSLHTYLNVNSRARLTYVQNNLNTVDYLFIVFAIIIY